MLIIPETTACSTVTCKVFCLTADVRMPCFLCPCLCSFYTRTRSWKMSHVIASILKICLSTIELNCLSLPLLWAWASISQISDLSYTFRSASKRISISHCLADNGIELIGHTQLSRQTQPFVPLCVTAFAMCKMIAGLLTSYVHCREGKQTHKI